jgi:hypothetical protein
MIYTYAPVPILVSLRKRRDTSRPQPTLKY